MLILQPTPAGSRAASSAGHIAGFLEVAQDRSNPVAPDARTIALQVRQAKFALVRFDGCDHQLGFGAPRSLGIPRKVIQLGISSPNNRQDEIEPWGQLVPALVPALRASMQTLVIVCPTFFKGLFVTFAKL